METLLYLRQFRAREWNNKLSLRSFDFIPNVKEWNIRNNFSEILEAIQSARVNQYAGRLYPDLGETSQMSAMKITALLQANMPMMRQLILAHERPGTVSFKSIRNTQAEFDFIKSKTILY